MNDSELFTGKEIPKSESKIKMNMKVIELKALAKKQEQKGYSRLRKAALIALLEVASNQRAPVAPPRKKGNRRAISEVKIILHPEDMVIFEEQEMEKTRLLVKSKCNEWYNWLVNHVQETIQSKANNGFKTFKNKIKGLWKKVPAKEIINNIVEDEAEKEHKAR